MIAAIHQPNFFPWLGFFRKVARADVFILLDCVQFPRTSRGTWTNRVRLLVSGRPAWVTCPVRRSGLQAIAEVEIDDDQPWRRKLLSTIRASYRRAPYFDAVFPVVEGWVLRRESRLAAFNAANIADIDRLLGLDARFRSSRELAAPKLAGSALLAELCRIVAADAYLAGDGAEGYERPEEYASRGVRLLHSRFAHPIYAQVGATGFQPGLSILDALFQCGPSETARLLRAPQDEDDGHAGHA